MRERQVDFMNLRVVMGITPAHAGKTCTDFHVIRHLEDHPRSCGKDGHERRRLRGEIGSPPLMRERPPTRPPFTVLLRITPAHAGKTRIQGNACVRHWDHPRSCGKDEKHAYSSINGKGSPPLMRERHPTEKIKKGDDRITPAHAGKTFQCLHCRNQLQDHPRSCGKDYEANRRKYLSAGSPPLMRERLKRNSSYHAE